ncbi:hypothetical protein BT69DRAFT_1286494 [Atractiella rhizophila]|nr:hypothetical protein BT69DRAFT_1286494 [Atractiella rhizophila]
MIPLMAPNPPVTDQPMATNARPSTPPAGTSANPASKSAQTKETPKRLASSSHHDGQSIPATENEAAYDSSAAI